MSWLSHLLNIVLTSISEPESSIHQDDIEIIGCHTKPLGCCMVKPNEQLVQVSYTHHCASTPCLSTS